MGLLYFPLFLKNSAAAAPACKGLAWIIQASRSLPPPTNPEKHLSRLVNIRAIRKPISDARAATYVILSIPVENSPLYRSKIPHP
jgi:hypothetical protein